MRSKKTLTIISCICIIFAFCFSFMQNITFATNQVTCEFRNGTLNNGSVEYTINNRTISIELATKEGEVFTKVNITNLQQKIDLDASYYLKFTDKDNVDLSVNGTTINDMPGDGYLMLTEDMFNGGRGMFELSQKHQQSEPSGPQTVYPIVAYFEGVNSGVQMDGEGTIVIPDGWETGKVTFKAKICTVDGVLAPDDGFIVPDEGSEQEITVRVEGIANGEQLNGTVIGSNDMSYVQFEEGFDECGKASIHITSVEERGPVNTFINLVNKDIIYLAANAPLNMSMSLGSAEVTQAIVTKNVEKSLSIFFGNTETNLRAEGFNVNKITKVTGGTGTTLNDDGTVTVQLPDLSKETTTKVNVTILLKDGSSIVRTVNIKRTAILLNYDDRENELKIGYVMNKAYLYNNQLHNDSIFDAYIQVILYKGNTVAGFKQIKVSDEEIVNALVSGSKYKGNNLPGDGAWSIETFSDEAMKIDLDSMEGITKASMFLTNGPLKAESNVLPSVEYGIGSGLTIEWEAK